jgi:hypothetical protein
VSVGHERRQADELVWAQWAVERWAGFPVERVPRPLVLVGQRTFVERGFRTGEAKLAYMYGRIECATPVPDMVLRTLPARREPVPAAREPAPLVIAGVTRCETEFRTDRGRRRLPAWRLDAPDALGPIWVLDPEVDPPEWCPHEPPPTPRPELQSPRHDPGAHGDLDPDGVMFMVHFTGALPEYEQYPRAEVIESPHAVAVVPIGVDVGPPPGVARILPGHPHKVTVHLLEPLGARVYVDVHGHAGEVLAATAD